MIRCPTLVLAGEEDILLPVPCAEELARGIAGAELVVLENTGHGMLIETPDAVAAAMLNFLARHPKLRLLDHHARRLHDEVSAVRPRFHVVRSA